MVSQNRILTVSYGTFSCTLEGFDDPFGTMKAIAEYFRDLAAEDRYFGAEPPQPDAAMLHRIAEREIQRRVEAKIQDNGNGVILRADMGERPASAPAPLARPEAPVAFAAAPVEAPADAEPEAVADMAPAPVADLAPRLRPVDDSVAAKLARIRAAVDRSRQTGPMVDDIDDAEVTETALAVAPATVAADDLADAPAGADAFDVADVLPELSDDAAAGLALDGDAEPAVAAMPVAEEVADETEWAAGTADTDEAEPADQTDAADEAFALAADPVLTAASAEAPEPDDFAVAEPFVLPSEPATPVAAPSVDVAELAPVPTEDPAPAAPAAQPAAVAPADPGRTRAGWHIRRRQRRLQAQAKAAAPVAVVAPVSAEALPSAVSEATDLTDDYDLDALEAALEGIEAEATAQLGAADAAVAAVADAADDLADEADVPEAAPVAVQAEAVDPAPLDMDSLIARIASETMPAAASTAVIEEPADTVIAALSDLVEPVAEPPAAPVAVRARVVKVRRAVPVAPPAEDLTPETDPGLVAEAARDALTMDAPQDAVESAVAADAQVLAEADAVVAAELPAPDEMPAAAAMPVAEAPQALTPAADGVSALPTRPARPVPVRPVLPRSTPRPVTQRLETLVPAAPAAASAAAAPVAPTRPARPVRPERPAGVSDRRGLLDAPNPSGEAAVDRLLRQTNSEMAEAETRRRTSTIAHLKAAVAATVAERLTPRAPGQPAVPADSTAAYRDDLASAVRPVRSETEARSAAPSRVAPLVLVSAQRIDRPAAAAPMMSRPSGNAAPVLEAVPQDDEDEAGPVNLFGGVSTLDDFLARIGTTDLAGRLEAAGAWLIVADELEGFNRPQLMRVAGADSAAESREAAMAAFGALLRDGRIVKARRGLFTLPETASVLAEARKLLA